jgi:glycosyltransferase involved in cell wall biosynthesis
MNITVIIPSQNRHLLLAKSLKALAHQELVPEYEVVVVDDGSTDKTKELVRSFIDSYPVPLRYHYQDHRGPAAARNIGITDARGDVLVIIGDDTIPASNQFLFQHLHWHRDIYSDANFAVLGRATWPPELHISPYMRWLENGGPQFAYYRLKHASPVGYRHFYTCNISLKRSFLDGELFNEEFPSAAYEDLEYGYRLEKRGLNLVYNKDALVFHDHEVYLRPYSSHRAFAAGRSRVLLHKLHPELASSWTSRARMHRILLLPCNSLTYSVWERIGIYCESRFRIDFIFAMIYWYHFYSGMEYGVGMTRVNP